MNEPPVKETDSFCLLPDCSPYLGPLSVAAFSKIMPGHIWPIGRVKIASIEVIWVVLPPFSLFHSSFLPPSGMSPDMTEILLTKSI